MADMKDGKGVFTWPDGRKYDGQWSKGKQHGRAKYTFSDGAVKNGVWDQGRRVQWDESSKQ